MKINKEDKTLIKAYCKWAIIKGFFPEEYEISRLIDNMNCDHRFIVEDYLTELKLKLNAESLAWNALI